MAKKREFGEGPIYLITNYIFWFVLCNLYFIVCTLPFVIYVVLTFMLKDPYGTFKDTWLILFLLSLLVGPALAASYSTMGKLIREKDLNVTKDYFKYYKMNFKQSFIVWAVQMTVNCLLYVNMSFYSQFEIGTYIKPVILTIGIIINVLLIVALPILSRFYFNFKDLLKCAFYYGIKKFYVTMGTIVIFIIAFIIISYIPQLILFVFSMISYSVMVIFKPVLNEIEKTLKKA